MQLMQCTELHVANIVCEADLHELWTSLLVAYWSLHIAQLE